ncbi:MAG: CinA family nicotinamide mononucleotide deamidase-related protein [Nitriliruptoraceae bacterium]
MSGSRPRPRAGILSVGSELLLGDLTDTNATWISQRLTEHGIEVVHHLAVGDDLDRLVSAVHWLAERTDLIIVGGGLGPTHDDLTREALAAAAGVELEYREELAEEIAGRFRALDRRMPEQNLRQARIPAGARIIPPVGTAPAFDLELSGTGGRTRVVALPGVPWELHELFATHVTPLLGELTGGGVTLTRVLHVAGRGESDVAEVIEPLVAAREGITLSFLAKAQEIQVRLTVSGIDHPTTFQGSQSVVDELVTALGGAVVGLDAEDLETVVLRLLAERGQTLATAESATAGDIAARLGRVAGAAAAFAGGVVVYATGAKSALLDVPAEVIAEHGPVSAETTGALARAVRLRLDTDYALAVTGVAGPSTVDELPVGTAFWALADRDGEVEVEGRRLPGDRGQVIARMGSAALDLLRRRLVDA